jgi:uncharacterized membrane protein
MFETCTETVSLLYAIVFGADGACVNIGMSSLIWAFVAFIVLVVIAQFFARKLWRKLRNAPAQSQGRRVGTIYDDGPDEIDEGPVRSSRR